MQFRHMTFTEIIDHFARSEDRNERELAQILAEHAERLKDLQDEHDNPCCPCGDSCNEHHCEGCTCWD